MASVKIVLRKKQNKDNSFPLTIRITKDRKSSFVYLGKNIKESDWDETAQKVRKSHPNSTRLNNFLLKKLSEATDKLLELETQRSDISSKSVKKGLKPSSGNSFFDQAKLFMSNMEKSGKYNRVAGDKTPIKRFREFLKGEDILFQDITIQLLTNFKAYLKGSKKISDRTVMNNLIIIRTLFNQAIKDQLVDPKHYPFGRGKISIKFPETSKIGLLPEEVKKIEALKLPKTKELEHDHARNVWLFSFYFAGMRVSDVLRLRWSDFHNERMFYSMGKNAKAGSLKIPEKAKKILSIYEKDKSKNKGFVFPDLNMIDDIKDTYKVQREITYAIKNLNKHLSEIATKAKINKPLSMHIARHTFGNISGDKISIQMLQKLYRHTSITTTIGYQANFIHKDADDALDSVVDF